MLITGATNVQRSTPALLGTVGVALVLVVLWAVVAPIAGAARDVPTGVEWSRPGQPLRF